MANTELASLAGLKLAIQDNGQDARWPHSQDGYATPGLAGTRPPVQDDDRTECLRLSDVTL